MWCVSIARVAGACSSCRGRKTYSTAENGRLLSISRIWWRRDGAVTGRACRHPVRRIPTRGGRTPRIGPEPCLLRRPQLVYGRMTGWGQDGPIAHTAGHDITYIAPTGALHAIGQAGGPPQIPLNLLGDFAGGSMYLLTGMLAALDGARRSSWPGGRRRDRRWQRPSNDHDLQLLCGGNLSDERGTNLGDGGSPFYGVYQTSDAKFMAVGALEPQFYAEFRACSKSPRIPPRSTTGIRGRSCEPRSAPPSPHALNKTGPRYSAAAMPARRPYSGWQMRPAIRN